MKTLYQNVSLPDGGPHADEVIAAFRAGTLEYKVGDIILNEKVVSVQQSIGCFLFRDNN